LTRTIFFTLLNLTGSFFRGKEIPGKPSKTFYQTFRKKRSGPLNRRPSLICLFYCLGNYKICSGDLILGIFYCQKMARSDKVGKKEGNQPSAVSSQLRKKGTIFSDHLWLSAEC